MSLFICKWQTRQTLWQSLGCTDFAVTILDGTQASYLGQAADYVLQPRAKIAAAGIKAYFDSPKYTIAPIADLTKMHIYIYGLMLSSSLRTKLSVSTICSTRCRVYPVSSLNDDSGTSNYKVVI